MSMIPYSKGLLLGSASFFLACTFANISPLRADTPAPGQVNLVKNPSFENPPESYAWKQNNWAKNDVEFALDPDNPHSGKQSQRITLRHGVNGKTDVQLVYQGLPLLPGTHLELRFWTRGGPTATGITVSLGTSFAPFAKYFSGDIKLSPTWTESVFQIVLPADANPQYNALVFELKEEATIWIDDVSLTEVPNSAGT